MLSGVSLRSRIAMASVLFSFACASCNLNAQQTSPPPNPKASGSQESPGSRFVLRNEVRRVVLDVVVSDADGKPVSGLTAADFTVAEDGKPQRVVSFDVHDFDPISDSLPKLPALPANTFVNLPAGPERGPLYVLFLDLLNMEVDDQPTARKQLLKFIQSKPLGTRFAIFVLSDGLYLVQGFTEDRNLLADTLDPKSPRSHIPRIFLYAANYRPYISVPSALISIAGFLADLPGHKNIIWLSGSFPSSFLPGSDPGTEAINYSEEIKQATDTLARGQTAVYPIDIRGVVVTSPTSSGGPSRGGADAEMTSDATLNASYMTEDEIAYATGGRAFHNSNDLAEEMTEAVETGGHYYTFTYAPSNPNYNGRLRHIHVTLAKRGFHLAYRRTYYGNFESSGNGSEREIAANDPAHLAPQPRADSLYANMQHGAPLAHQLLFRARVHCLAKPSLATPEQMQNLADQPVYFRVRRKNKPAKPMKPIEIQGYEINYTVAARQPTLEVAAAAFNEDGQMLNGVIQKVEEPETPIPAEASRGGIYRIQQQIDVPVTAKSIRVAIRDMATDNVGALEMSLPLAPETQKANVAAPAASSSSATTTPGKPN